MTASLEMDSQPVDSELSKDFITLFSGRDQEHVPHTIIHEIILGGTTKIFVFIKFK